MWNIFSKMQGWLGPTMPPQDAPLLKMTYFVALTKHVNYFIIIIVLFGKEGQKLQCQ